MAAPPFSDLQIISQLSSGSRWWGSTIAYAFPKTASNIYGGAGERVGFSPLNSTQIAAAELALVTWDDLIRPDFLASVNSASDVELGYTTTGIDYAHAYTPNIGSVWFSSLYPSLRTPTLGKSGFETYIHELGHAIGLEHMGNYNGAGLSTPSSWQDSMVYTVMSYYGPNSSLGGEGEVAWADWIGLDGVAYSPQTPMVNDVMAIQSIYGQESTREDNTVYGFGSTITDRMASIYDFSQNLNPILCIYDSNGIDTLNVSGWSAPSIVDLMAGPDHFSSGNGMTHNIQIARGVLIENAVTGAGNDQITGNEVANTLRGQAGNDTINGGAGNDTINGGAGNDTINGGEGSDTLLFSGRQLQYHVDYDINSGQYTLQDQAGTDGLDRVTAVEWAQFSDASVELPFLVSSAVYRFYNTAKGVHFYTGSATEAQIVKQSLPDFSLEGIVFHKSDASESDIVDVYRFYNKVQNAHFYTADSYEAEYIRTNLANFRDEGIAFQAHQQNGFGLSPLYRFYNTQTGTHFYTASSTERDHVIATLTGVMNYENVAFYVEV